MQLQSDWIELLREFNAAGVKYLVVGAHAVNYYARPRATGDLDIFIEPTRENAERCLRALRAFEAPLHDLTVEDLSKEDTVFQIGVEPIRADVLTSIDGVAFEEAWRNRASGNLDGVPVQFIGKSELRRNKAAAGRHKDLADLERLEE